MQILNLVIIYLLLIIIMLTLGYILKTLTKITFQIHHLKQVKVGDNAPDIKINGDNLLEIGNNKSLILLFINPGCDNCNQLLNFIRNKEPDFSCEIIIFYEDNKSFLKEDQMFRVVKQKEAFKLYGIDIVPTAILIENGKVKKRELIYELHNFQDLLDSFWNRERSMVNAK
ncbi:hypothetical protein EV207_107102 [Scopulibacillus darangshiensis]|uniref:Thioredoxin domain-containing protein n=1 Tax=Scopulibacillus darangshiensis TaxID=442528 RepID=A0A4R2P6Z2_9BACL|nr:hypothetical protein [Scopulibacillus darangshiensis]TCP30008.1 hypothetical protein EV207_107102 [Scopulibacillus darangshiensis]